MLLFVITSEGDEVPYLIRNAAGEEFGHLLVDMPAKGKYLPHSRPAEITAAVHGANPASHVASECVAVIAHVGDIISPIAA